MLFTYDKAVNKEDSKCHNFINIGPILNCFASMSLSCCTDYFEPKHDMLICRNKKVNFFTYAGAKRDL